MGGEPVFKGTRVPIANVVASKRAGIDLDELQAAYPFLTVELVEDAETYKTIHPKVGRPRREPEGAAPMQRRKLISREVVPLPGLAPVYRTRSIRNVASARPERLAVDVA